jgi:hypothetical protein
MEACLIDDSKTIVDHDPKRRPRVHVTIHDSRNPWPLRLYFGSFGANAPFLGFTVLANRELDPRSFAQLARNLGHYVEYARALVRWDRGGGARALDALRQAGQSRGLPDRFYKAIADEYIELVEADDPHPIKTIAEARPVHKSRASRWVKEARQRGYIAG